SRDAAIAVKKRVNPQEAVMRCSGGQDRFRPPKVSIDVLEPRQKARQRSRANGDEMANLYITMAQLTRHHRDFLSSVRIAHLEQFCWEQLAKATVNFAERPCRHCAP